MIKKLYELWFWLELSSFRNFEKSEHSDISWFGNLEIGTVQTKSEHLAGMKIKGKNKQTNKQKNKAVLEPWVSPAFVITYLCNHCNIRFDPIPVKVRKRSLTPEWSLTPRLLIIVSKSHENTSKYVDTVTLFAKTWTKGHWPIDDLWPPHLLTSHVWLYPRIIVSKSHGNTSMYVDTINFANYHIHTHNHIVSFWTTFRGDKKQNKTNTKTKNKTKQNKNKKKSPQTWP